MHRCAPWGHVCSPKQARREEVVGGAAVGFYLRLPMTLGSLCRVPTSAARPMSTSWWEEYALLKDPLMVFECLGGYGSYFNLKPGILGTQAYVAGCDQVHS